MVVCPVCLHPERDAIEASAVTGENPRVIAVRHGLTKAAVEKHLHGDHPRATSDVPPFVGVSRAPRPAGGRSGAKTLERTAEHPP